MVPRAADLIVAQPDHPFVGRGGLKLAGALDAFRVDPAGLVALDVGASTGGFTDCLLKRGARRVYALDVGRGQLDWSLRQDPRVVVLEGRNARYLVPRDLPERTGMATVDVSFISLRLILRALPPVLERSAPALVLVKPQFEVGRRDVGPGGIVREPSLHLAALARIGGAATEAGFGVRAACASAIAGAEGNREFFLHLVAGDEGLAPAEREALFGRIVHGPDGTAEV